MKSKVCETGMLDLSPQAHIRSGIRGKACLQGFDELGQAALGRPVCCEAGRRVAISSCAIHDKDVATSFLLPHHSDCLQTTQPADSLVTTASLPCPFHIVWCTADTYACAKVLPSIHEPPPPACPATPMISDAQILLTPRCKAGRSLQTGHNRRLGPWKHLAFCNRKALSAARSASTGSKDQASLEDFKMCLVRVVQA